MGPEGIICRGLMSVRAHHYKPLFIKIAKKLGKQKQRDFQFTLIAYSSKQKTEK